MRLRTRSKKRRLYGAKKKDMRGVSMRTCKKIILSLVAAAVFLIAMQAPILHADETEAEAGVQSEEKQEQEVPSLAYRTASDLNLRILPDASSAIIAIIPGDTILIIEQQEPLNGWWMQVTYNGRTGYINSSFIIRTPALDPIYAIPETTPAPETEAPTEPPTTEAPETEAPTEPPTTEAPRMSTIIEKNGDPAHSVLQVITGYAFPDGSVDVWMTGTAFYAGQGKVITAAANAGFTGDTDPRYEAILEEKQKFYSSLGIDLSDYEALAGKVKTYLCLPDGTYEEVREEKRDELTGCTALSYRNHDLHVEAVSFTEREAEETVTVMGFTAAALEATGDAIAAGDNAAANVAPVKTDVQAAYKDGSITLKGNVNRGFAGAILLNKDNKVLGVITEANGKSGKAIPAGDLISFIRDMGVATEVETVPSTEIIPETQPAVDEEELQRQSLRERLTIAVNAAKSIDLTGYSTDSANAFRNAIADAELLLTHEDASAELMEAAGNALNTAKNGLTKEEEPEERQTLPTSFILMVIGFVIVLFVVVFLVVKYVFFSEDETEKGKAKKSAGYGGGKSRKGRKKGSADEDGEDGDAETELLDEEDEEGFETGDAETGLLSLENNLGGYLIYEKDNTRIELNKRITRIGKQRRKVDFCITDNSTVSRVHCAIRINGDDYYLEDLGSKNGTLVNGVLIDPRKPVRLLEGTEIIISDEHFLFGREQEED